MDRTQFASYAAQEGYSFFGNRQTEKVSGVQYKKGSGPDSKYILLEDLFYDFGKCVNYQTWQNSEYDYLKKDMVRYGFLFFESQPYQSRDGLVKTREAYRNSVYEISIFITPNQNTGYTQYEISLLKY